MYKALLRNKLDKAGDVILCDDKTKNVDIAVAMARLFNAVSVQKNKPEWLSYFVTMPKLFILLLFMALFILVGCIKILNEDLKSEETKLVLNAAISPDSSFLVNISRTFNIFDDDSDENLPFIDGAKVSLFENEQYLFDLENLGYGYYSKSDFYPKTGEEYNVEASYKGYKSIKAKTIIPPPVPIREFDTVMVIINDVDESWTELYGLLTYDDPPDVKNYYQLVCRILISDASGKNKWQDQSIWVPGNDATLFDRTFGNLLWSDIYSDSKEVTIRFGFYSVYSYEERDLSVSDKISFVFSFQSVSEEYYTYLKSLNLFYESGGGDPFTEPVVIYSNIENGYGILGGYDQDTTSFHLIWDNDEKGVNE